MLDIGLTLFVRLLIGILRVVPIKVAESLAGLWIRALCGCVPRWGRSGLRNLEIAFPEKSNAAHQQILLDSYLMLGKNLVGFARMGSLRKEAVYRDFSYETVTAQIAAARKKHPDAGVLFATMHYGGFETTVQMQCLCDRPLGILARGFGFRRLDRWWNRQREQFGNNVFGRTGGYREMETRLRNGQDITAMFDQNVKRNHAVFVPFFGVPAATTKGLALAALRTNAAILQAVSAETAPGKYELTVTYIPYDDLEHLPVDARVFEVMRRLHQPAEAAIRRHPDHWFWIHRRFKTRSAGESEDLYIDRA